MTVYFVNEMGGACCMKIGYTSADHDEVEARLAQLQVGNSRELRIFGEIPGGSPRLERALHMYFGEYYVRGEWFDIPEEVLEPFMIEWVWPWPEEDELLAYLYQNMPDRELRDVVIDNSDPDMWRMETKTYTRKDGNVSVYYNYRLRKVHRVNGRQRVLYRKGGKR